jgi:hypothetical protein
MDDGDRRPRPRAFPNPFGRESAAGGKRLALLQVRGDTVERPAPDLNPVHPAPQGLTPAKADELEDPSARLNGPKEQGVHADDCVGGRQGGDQSGHEDGAP